jgi:hypothetical protein
MNYINYIFLDKKSKIYWISIFVFISFLSIVNYMMHGKEEDASLVLFTVPLLTLVIIYFGFYLTSFWKYQKQLKYRKWIEEKLNLGLFLTKKVELLLDSFTLKPPMLNYDALIKIKTKSVSFEILEIENSFLILGYVFDFGIFKRHLRPLVVSKTYNKTLLREGAILRNSFEIMKHNNHVKINLEKSFEGIRCLKFEKSN